MDPIGYGIFGFVRGSPEKPGMPQNLHDTLYVYVNEALREMRAAGFTPVLARELAVNLEMMFLPPDGIDPGFSDQERNRVFDLLFDPRNAGPVQQQLQGVDDQRVLVQRVLELSLQLGYYHTAEVIGSQGGSIADLFRPRDGRNAHWQTTLDRIGLVPLHRRIPTLRLILDQKRLPSTGKNAGKWGNFRLALTNAIIQTDDVELFRRRMELSPPLDGHAALEEASRYRSLAIMAVSLPLLFAPHDVLS